MEGKQTLQASILSVKIIEDIRLSFPITTTFEQMKAEVLAKCGFGTKAKHCVKYEDEEGDFVTLASEADFREALQIIASTNLLKLTVVVKSTPDTSTSPSAASDPVESTSTAPEPTTNAVHSSGDIISKEERKRIKKEKKALRKAMKHTKQACTEDSAKPTAAPITDAHETLVSKEEEKAIEKKRKREEKAQLKEMKRAMKAEIKQQKKTAKPGSLASSRSSENRVAETVVKPKHEPTAASIPVESATTAPKPTTIVHPSVISKEERKRIKELKHAKKTLRKEMKRAKQATEEAAESEAFANGAPETVVANEEEKHIEKALKRKQKREERPQAKESKRQQQVAQSATSSFPSVSPSSSSEVEMAALQQQLEQLGFHDKVKNERVLKRHQGSIESAVACLRRMQERKVEKEAKKAVKEEMKKIRRAAKEAEKHRNKEAKTAQ